MNDNEALEFIKRLIQIEQDATKGFHAASASVNMQLSQLIMGQLDRLGPEPTKKMLLTHVCKQEEGDEVYSYTAVDVSHQDSAEDYIKDFETRSSRRVRLRNTSNPNETYRENEGITTPSNDKLVLSNQLKNKGQQAKNFNFKKLEPSVTCIPKSDSTYSTSEISVPISSHIPIQLSYIQQIKRRAIALYNANVPTLIISRLLDIQDPWIIHVWGDFSQFPTKYSNRLCKTREECLEMHVKKFDLNSIAKALKITPHKVKCHLQLQGIFENFIPLEHRLDAVKAVIQGENVAKTAEIFGVPEHTLRSWLNQYTETRTIKMSSEDRIVGDGDYDGLMIRKALEEYFMSRDLKATAEKLNIVPAYFIRRWVNLLTEPIKNKSIERFLVSLQEAAIVVEEDTSNQSENTDALVMPISPITVSQSIEEELPSSSPQDM